MNVSGALHRQASHRLERMGRQRILRDYRAFADKYFGWDLYECQERWAHLADKHPKLLLNTSVDSGKSGMFGLIYPLAKICENPEMSIFFGASGFDTIAKPTGRVIREHLQHNEALIRDFGPFYLSRNPWRDDAFIVRREDAMKRDYTLRAGAPGMSIEGGKFDLVILDDIINRSSSTSVAARRDALIWWQSTMRQRMVKGARIIVAGSLWHPEDLYAEMKGMGFHSVRQPAVLADGSLLCPERHDAKFLDDMRGDLGAEWFDLRFMVNPRAISGNLLDPMWLKYYERDELPTMLLIVQTIDTSSGKSAGDWYVRMTLGWGEDGRLYILDYLRTKIRFPAQVKDVYKGARHWKPDRIVIETNFDGGALYSMVLHEYPELNGYVFPHNETRNKIAKIQAAGVHFERGRILIHKSHHAFRQEFSNFPGAHDDLLDCAVMGIDVTIVASHPYAESEWFDEDPDEIHYGEEVDGYYEEMYDDFRRGA